MDFKQLEAFAYVVKLGSFSRAAQQLYLTQPTISAHIGTLEKELGVQLIVRGAKAALPTETGKVLYGYALDMLSLRDNAVAACKSGGAEPRGVVHIAASTVTYQYVLPKIMSLFRGRYGGVTFDIHSCDSEGVVSEIAQGLAEIGMTGAIMGEDKCVYRELMEDQLVVIAPNQAPYTGMDGEAFSLEDLRRAPFILREVGSGTRKAIESYLGQRGMGVKDLNVVAHMVEPDAIKNAVSQGLGISIVSQLAVQDFQKLGLVRTFALEGRLIARKLYIVHHKSRPLSPAAAIFMRFVEDFYA